MDNQTRSLVEELLRLINKYRTQNGRGSLAIDSHLQEAAQYFADLLAEKNPTLLPKDHVDPKGNTFGDRVQKKFQFPADRDIGEIIGRTPVGSGPNDPLNLWKDSEGHNANLLCGKYQLAGIGVARGGNNIYWVVDFGGSSPSNSQEGSECFPMDSPRFSSPVPSIEYPPARLINPLPPATPVVTPPAQPPVVTQPPATQPPTLSVPPRPSETNLAGIFGQPRVTNKDRKGSKEGGKGSIGTAITMAGKAAKTKRNATWIIAASVIFVILLLSIIVFSTRP